MSTSADSDEKVNELLEGGVEVTMQLISQQTTIPVQNRASW